MRDRLHAEHDCKIILKAELEIRHRHERLDHLAKQQWTRLMEIQEIQLELMEELAERKHQFTERSKPRRKRRGLRVQIRQRSRT